MQIIPALAIPSQTFNVSLGGQACTINLYQKGLVEPALYLDLYVSSALIIGGVMCRNATAIVRDAYLGFIGDLAFYDTQGVTDPLYTGIGSRYILLYFSPGDAPGTAVQTIQVAA
jgi:hypothetical protein